MAKISQPITQDEIDGVCNFLVRDGRATVELADAGPKTRASDLLRAAARLLGLKPSEYTITRHPDALSISVIDRAGQLREQEELDRKVREDGGDRRLLEDLD